MKEALKLALDFIIATNKSSGFWLVPASNLNKVVTAIKEALAQQEPRNFCPRCGKRLIGMAFAAGGVHTCTPPRGLEMK